MAITVETGAGVAGAESFVTVAQYDTANVELFGAAGTETTALKESALRRAWYHMKALSWKADYAFPTLGGTIPADVKTAQAVFARYEIGNVNGLAPSVVMGQQKVLNRVGEIGWQVTGQGGIEAQRATVTMAMDLLAPYINDTGNTKFLLRA